MVSADTLLNYPYWEILFTVHIDTSVKQLGDVIRKNNKPIAFFSRKCNRFIILANNITQLFIRGVDVYREQNFPIWII